MRSKKFYIRVRLVGPGGWKCPCCGPAPKHRTKVNRADKKRLRVILSRIVKEDMIEE